MQEKETTKATIMVSLGVNHPNRITLTTLQFWRTYYQQRDAIKKNKQVFQVLMLKENKVCFSKLQDCLIHYSKVFGNISHFKKTKFKHLCLVFHF